MSCPYVIEERPGIGRCAVASRNLEPLESLMVDFAAVSGPDELTTIPVCLICYAPIEDEEFSTPCKKCKIPLCSKECAEISIQGSSNLMHVKFECEFLAKRGVSVQFNHLFSLMKCILPLRMLILKKVDPDLHKKNRQINRSQ